MVHLLSVHDAFHARVIAARLGSDGILTQLKGPVDGPYPMLGEVRVYVDEEDLPVARELLLADEVESAFEPTEPGEDVGRGSTVPVWIAVVAVVLITAMYLTRGL
jgi:hypothetical protein